MDREEIRDKYTSLSDTAPYYIWLVVGNQSFTLAAEYDEISEAKWYRERLVDAIEKIMEERK